VKICSYIGPNERNLNFAKIYIREKVKVGGLAKIYTRENKYIYSIGIYFPQTSINPLILTIIYNQKAGASRAQGLVEWPVDYDDIVRQTVLGPCQLIGPVHNAHDV